MSDIPAALERGFRVGYQKDAADFRVWAAGIGGAGLIALWLLGHGDWAFWLGAGGFAIAGYFLPLANTAYPRLAASDIGIAIDALGVLPWTSVSNLEVQNIVVRTMANRDIVITLRTPIGDALSEDWRAPFPLRYLMFKCWRPRGERVVLVNLEVLASKPEAVMTSIESLRPAS